MPSKASSPVQTSVYALMAADSALAGLAPRIGDSMPEGSTARAFVVITVISETPDRRLFSGAGGNARRLLVSVASHVEDTQERTGASAVQAISRRVVELLDNATLTVAGWTFVSCDYLESAQQQDGSWRSITDDFEILVEDT